MTIINPSTEVHRVFFSPLWTCLEASPHQRQCSDYSDRDFLELGVTRVLLAVQSGRDLLQRLALLRETCPERSNFFEALKSNRRLGMVEDVGERLRQRFARSLPDALAEFPALDDFDVYAADGHSHSHAVHDAPVDGTKLVITHLYALNLRNGWHSHLGMCRVKERGNHHDMAVLKSLPPALLRLGAKRGRKVIHVYDRAGLDFGQWYRWKQGSGIYFISRMKDTVVLSVKVAKEFDSSDPINANVLSDEIVTPATSNQPLRRIRFYDVSGQVTYEFLTNEMTLPPGLIAHLYKMRWNIEKKFDVFKNKLHENKAWASSETAKCMQAQFLCLASNLLLLLEHHIETKENLRNEAEMIRRKKRLDAAIKSSAKIGQTLPLALRKLQQMTQHSVKFIRWVAALLFCPIPWNQAINSLRASYAEL